MAHFNYQTKNRGRQRIKGYAGYSIRSNGFRAAESRQPTPATYMNGDASFSGSALERYQAQSSRRMPTSFANIGGGLPEHYRRRSRPSMPALSTPDSMSKRSPFNNQYDSLEDLIRERSCPQVRRDIAEMPPPKPRVIRPTENGFGHAFAFGSPGGHQHRSRPRTGGGGWHSEPTARLARVGHSMMKKMGNRYVFGGMPKDIDQKANPLYHTAASEVGAKAYDKKLLRLNPPPRGIPQEFSKSFTSGGKRLANTGLITAIDKRGWGLR
eukprot:g1263.t1